MTQKIISTISITFLAGSAILAAASFLQITRIDTTLTFALLTFAVLIQMTREQFQEMEPSGLSVRDLAKRKANLPLTSSTRWKDAA